MSNIYDVAIQAPGICFICESATGPFYDTVRNFEPGGPTKLSGRKYICQGCAYEVADVFGCDHPDKADEKSRRIEELEEKMGETTLDLQNARAFVKAFTDSFPDVAAKAAPKKEVVSDGAS